jgi:chromosome segregation ATPase
MAENTREEAKDRRSYGEGPLGELAQFLLENPWFDQAVQLAFGARERASQASANAMRNLNVPTAADIDRLGRRVRAVSQRLESVEDKLDQLSREIAALRREASDRIPSTRA